MGETAGAGHLLDAFPLFRFSTTQEACSGIGAVFSPHRLALEGDSGALDVRHNQLRMTQVSLNVLAYGAGVLIDADERGDFYMVQLPLAGSASLACGTGEIRGDDQTLTVLQPRMRTRMRWSDDCAMILVQVPRSVVDERAAQWGWGAHPRFALWRSRKDPGVAAWWQATLDLTLNLDRHGAQWLRHPAACSAMEEFLLSAFTSMLSEPLQHADDRAGGRCLRRAKEYIHANLSKPLTVTEIARHACVSPRTLEVAFKRSEQLTPLAYVRQQRLEAVHLVLQDASRSGADVRVTDVAMSHGFVHLGRFAAHYRGLFGCSPSTTLRPH